MHESSEVGFLRGSSGSFLASVGTVANDQLEPYHYIQFGCALTTPLSEPTRGNPNRVDSCPSLGELVWLQAQ